MKQPRKPCVSFCSALLPALALSAGSLVSAVAWADPLPAAAPDNPGDAQPSRAECVSSHQSAQELKRIGKFLEAQEKLLTCSSRTCPGAIISDCGHWIDELEQKTPSMVFEVRRDSLEATGARVFVDEQLVTDPARALKVNPGRHTVRAELPPFAPLVENLVLREGQRLRLVTFAFHTEEATRAATPAATPAASPLPPEPVASPRPAPLPPPRRPTPMLVYPLLGVAAAGGVSFAVFSLMGRSKQNELEQQCKPDCTDADLKPMKRSYLIADVSAAVGGAALLGAAILYLARPEESPMTSSATSWRLGQVLDDAPESLGIVAFRNW
jgi:hypothetical protein